jgi:hypothetical protein
MLASEGYAPFSACHNADPAGEPKLPYRSHADAKNTIAGQMHIVPSALRCFLIDHRIVLQARKYGK